MQGLLHLSKIIDGVSEKVAQLSRWTVLVAVVVCSFNAVFRKLFSSNPFFQAYSNAMFESLFFFFGCMFLLGAGYTLRRDEHVRIDVLASRYSERAQVKMDVVGILFFMLPSCILLLWYSLSFFTQSLASNEHSGNSQLVLWPFKLLMVAGFGLLILQGLSELIKRVAYLKGLMAFSEFRKAGHNPDDEVKAYVEATQ
ncbi:MAG: TRAP transporter small permease subunit [Formosimonas sp.]